MRLNTCVDQGEAGKGTGHSAFRRAALLAAICCAMWGSRAFAETRADWNSALHPEHGSIADADLEKALTPESGLLTFERRDAQDFAGSVESSAGVVRFRAVGLTAGGQKVAGLAAPAVTRIVIDLDGAPIDIEFSEASQSVQIRQATGLTIERRHQALLQTFAAEVQRQLFLHHRDPNKLSATELRLWKLTEMYAEVPYGYRFDGERTVSLRAPVVISEDRVSKFSDGSTIDPGAFDDQPVLNDFLMKACTNGGGSTLTNLKNSKDVCDRRKTATRTASHDFCPSHGYISETHGYGCATSNCKGRCGPGCTMGVLPSGYGAWGQDCLEHDVCNQAHNSQLGACSDEFNDASDDYLLLPNTCFLGCNN